MSSASRSKSAVWYKVYYDKILVVAVLVALLVSALFLLWRITEARGALTDVRWTRVDADHNPYERADIADFVPFVRRLEAPFQIAMRDTRMLVSELRVMSVNPDVRTPIPYDAEVCPWTQFPQPTGPADTTGDGIPDEWYIRYGLDPFDTTLAARDLDGDGFTVREEFDAGSSPVDPADHPSYAYTLRVRRVATRPFDLRFQGVSVIAEGDERYMLNVRGEDRSYFARMGDTVRGYKLVEFQRRTREGMHGRQIDSSVLTLERGDGRRVDLVIDRDVTIDDRVAELVFLVDGSTYRVNIGDEITLMGNTYKVIDIQRDQVVIRDEGMGLDVTVGRMTPGDRLPERTVAEPVGFEALFEGLTTD